MSVLKNMRDYVSGRIDESAMKQSVLVEDSYDFENDPDFLRECADLLMPSIIQDALMDEAAFDTLDEDTRNAFIRVQNYLVENGIMSEATVSINNPKVTFVRLNKEARKRRLTSIISLKMARKNKAKEYQKYKLGTKIKKENFAKIMQRYGAKAERLATKLIQQARKGKVGAVVEKTKADRAEKKK